MRKYYLTTAIDYVNGEPHVGHAYEKILADAIARYHRLAGDETFFLLGTDEHGQKVERAARDRGLDAKTHVDRLAPAFEAAWRHVLISHDRFIRTTEPAHARAVQALFSRIHDAGDIYRSSYEGLYCERCEAFYTEKDLVDGKCPVHRVEPKALKEENYFFRLSKYAGKLLEHIERNPEFVLPASRRNEVLEIIRGGLNDISVSRASVKWGVPFPIDAEHTVYVWFDALINYITGVGFPDDPATFGRWWPADLHVIGKDIIRFHCVIWPAMLLSAGIPLPKTVFVHGFIYARGERFSKSSGNVVSPEEATAGIGPDALRYFFLREVPLGQDGDFTWDTVRERYNTDLANELGNLVSRTFAMVDRYRGGIAPPAPPVEGPPSPSRVPFAVSLDLLLRPEGSPETGSSDPRPVLTNYQGYFERFQIHVVIREIWGVIRGANKYVEERAPWALAKDPAKSAELDEVLATLLETVRIVATLLWPVMPGKCEEILRSLGEGESLPPRLEGLRWGGYGGFARPGGLAGRKLARPPILFPKQEDTKAGGAGAA